MAGSSLARVTTEALSVSKPTGNGLINVHSSLKFSEPYHLSFLLNTKIMQRENFMSKSHGAAPS